MKWLKELWYAFVSDPLAMESQILHCFKKEFPEELFLRYVVASKWVKNVTGQFSTGDI